MIDEIFENDNSCNFPYVINSTAIVPLEISDFYNTYRENIQLLNPIMIKKNFNENVIVEISNSFDFDFSKTIVKNFDTLLTRVEFINIIPGLRYFYRAKLDYPSSYWSLTKSFIQKENQFSIFIDQPFKEKEKFGYNGCYFDTVNKSWQLYKMNRILKILSAGKNDGSFGSILYDGYEQLPNTYYWGIATAIIDSITLQPFNIKYFYAPDPGVGDSLKNYINSLSIGTLIAMAIGDDAAYNLLGSANSPPRNAIKTLGSMFIDSVKFREGWCILGRKGATIGSVPEVYKPQFAGVAQIEVSKEVTYDSGYVVFPEMRFSNKWNYIKVESERPENSNIIYVPIGINRNGQTDTLYQFQTSLDSIDLSGVDAKIYPSIRLMAKLFANSQKESPKIFSVGANYEPVPELAVNYQTISIDRDTIMQGEAINYSAKIFNVGKSAADTFKILLELIKGDNSSYILVDSIVSRLNPNSNIQLNFQYINKIYDGYGDFAF